MWFGKEFIFPFCVRQYDLLHIIYNPLETAVVKSAIYGRIVESVTIFLKTMGKRLILQ